jgi:XTP/dITP diphosphohydrolase
MTPGREEPGSQLRRAVEVMDRLRSPGGCPWDAEQTHASLTRYLLEETYEVLEAIETGDLTLLREELGDLLLQVLFHARIAAELPADAGRFDIEDVAGDLVDKLIARHPHVFAGVQVASVQEQTELWEELKVAEKGRTSAVDGVPLAQPALALAAKLISRADRAGLTAPASGALNPRVARNGAPLDGETRHSAGASEDEIGLRLFELVREAVAVGVDPEAALRRTARAFGDAVVAAESAQ